MTEELLVNFKNLMQRWFPLTTQMNTLLDTKVNISDIKNNLTSVDSDKPLSAYQGRILNENKLEKLSLTYSSGNQTWDIIVNDSVCRGGWEIIDGANSTFVNIIKTNTNINIENADVTVAYKNQFNIPLKINYTVFIEGRPAPYPMEEILNPQEGSHIHFCSDSGSDEGIDEGIDEDPIETETVYNVSEIGYSVSVRRESTNAIADIIYPIGSIYMNINDIPPSVLFGGYWERLQDRFLLGAGTSYSGGSTGGAASVTLTANQSGLKAHGHGMAHNHNHRHKHYGNWSIGTGSSDAYVQSANRKTTAVYTEYDNTASSKTTTDNNTASNASEAHNNMPPYLTVYMWKRIA